MFKIRRSFQRQSLHTLLIIIFHFYLDRVIKRLALMQKLLALWIHDHSHQQHASGSKISINSQWFPSLLLYLFTSVHVRRLQFIESSVENENAGAIGAGGDFDPNARHKAYPMKLNFCSVSVLCHVWVGALFFFGKVILSHLIQIAQTIIGAKRKYNDLGFNFCPHNRPVAKTTRRLSPGYSTPRPLIHPSMLAPIQQAKSRQEGHYN